MLKITQPEDSPLPEVVQYKERPTIVIIGRVHPGETCGSHMMHGVMQFLTSKENKNAATLRSMFKFILVPMMNVDGVILGNFRAGLSGDDLNRSYLKPSPKLHPSVFHIKSYISNSKNVVFFLDLHGHSTKPNVFSYGPDLSKTDPVYDYARMYSKLVDHICEPFKFNKCTWRIHKSKKATARAVFLKKSKFYIFLIL